MKILRGLFRQMREAMFSFLADTEELQAQRRNNIFRHQQYLKHCAQLDDFQVYVLDKLEIIISPQTVLDTRHYADTPEIEACLRHFSLSMLRVRP
eukprot:6601023-Karenia_brevis.AAC.1